MVPSGTPEYLAGVGGQVQRALDPVLRTLNGTQSTCTNRLLRLDAGVTAASRGLGRSLWPLENEW